MSRVRSIVRRILRRDPNMQPNICFGQDGEDLVLSRIIGDKKDGLYIDIGAHHPVRFSNTNLFYQRGWRGINIDAMPNSMKVFDRLRPRDINLEYGIGEVEGIAKYYRFNEPALNTFSAKEAAEKNQDPYYIIEEVNLKIRRLDTVLSEHLRAEDQIDFMSVDVEGMELEIFSSNNWEKFRPKIILAEVLRTELLDIANSPIVQTLAKVGYRPIYKVYNTVYFTTE